MKPQTFLVVAATAVCALAVTSLAAKPGKSPTPPKPKCGGTDILHWSVRKGMENEGVLTNATGCVVANQNQQGKANNQRLEIAVARLETNTTYQLYAAMGDATNFTYVTNFASDARGKAWLRYVKIGASTCKGLGKGKSPLPDLMDPISHLRALAVANVNTQAVLTADLAAPDKLEYLIKRTLTEGDVFALLHLKATTRVLQFKLLSWGLTPGTNYLLAVNDTVLSSGNTDTNGFLSFTALPISASNILDVHTLAIWDAASNSVISTELP